MDDVSFNGGFLFSPAATDVFYLYYDLDLPCIRSFSFFKNLRTICVEATVI